MYAPQKKIPFLCVHPDFIAQKPIWIEKKPKLVVRLEVKTSKTGDTPPYVARLGQATFLYHIVFQNFNSY